ncbi:MAG: hypothetical protein CSA82_01565 [Actinobacteria bacterium]|nr:MAG: hypothetical protein CSA82_01565 [Actinomycetota bacterium]
MNSSDEVKNSPLLASFPVGSPMDDFLRKALAGMKEETEDQKTKELLADVLAGKRSVQEVADTRWFRQKLAAVDTEALLKTSKEAGEAAKEQGDFTTLLARKQSQ